MRHKSKNLNIYIRRGSGCDFHHSDPDILQFKIITKNDIELLKTRITCDDLEKKFVYKIYIDGDLMREIWWWKESKDYDVIMDLIGG